MIVSIETDRQLENTKAKLLLVEEQIRRARLRPATPERDDSVRSLVQTANQLKEEIVRYRSQAKLRRAV